jgi:hypothetical protein
MQDLSAKQLRRAAEIKEKIEALQIELNQLLQGKAVNRENGAPKKRGPQSAAARERIAAAQRRRWAKHHAAMKKG